MYSQSRLIAFAIALGAATPICAVAQQANGTLAPKFDPSLPTIVVLATGGTIAGAAGSDVQAGYTSGQVGVEQLLAAVPQARKLANLRGEQISNIGSQDMNVKSGSSSERASIRSSPCRMSGVVITHGTEPRSKSGVHRTSWSNRKPSC
jgi:L-asparaginase/Glu-tRNA(Gln) amidotransferase subunit D